MDNLAATLYCPNHRCQAGNPQTHKFCQTCRTPLIKRYLWAIGSALDTYKLGEMIGSRYLLVDQRLLLDTQPATPPETPPEIPPQLLPYLRLSPYRLHLPQVYGQVTVEAKRKRLEIWLLEDIPIQETPGETTPGQVLPELIEVWPNTPPLRQLNWLWQWANLWQPLSSEGVATSLLQPTLIRVGGSILQLLELYSDRKTSPTLAQLGKMWLQLLPGVSPLIAPFFQPLCTQLVEGQIRTSDQLIALLDQALFDYTSNPLETDPIPPSSRYQIFTSTDPGPSRSNNEDACYPPSGQPVAVLTQKNALAIVCDGIGGQDAGEVASQLAIEALWEEVHKLPDHRETWNPTTLTLELEQAVCAANDLISQRNDQEQRLDRQRMGTTVVMARPVAHEMYITHVGDSRVYWITRQGCHQVTQDDDLATREVRLGYSLYRDAIQQPTSGALVQALGMSPSVSLHPTVQRFVLDEDCIFLLCSDGLSDNDRVEQYWQSEILPILEGERDLPTGVGRLIEIANRENGHDNVTIALVYCQVTPPSQTRQRELSVPQPASIPTTSAAVPKRAMSQMRTQQLPTRRERRQPWGLLLGIFVLLGLGGVLAYVLMPRGWIRITSIANSESPSSPSLSASPEPTPTKGLTLDRLTLLKVNTEILTLDAPLVRVPIGSILQVTGQSGQPSNRLLYLKVCTLGEANAQTLTPQKPNAEETSTDGSWMQETKLQEMISNNRLEVIDPAHSPTNLGSCILPTDSTPSSSPEKF